MGGMIVGHDEGGSEAKMLTEILQGGRCRRAGEGGRGGRWQGSGGGVYPTGMVSKMVTEDGNQVLP